MQYAVVGHFKHPRVTTGERSMAIRAALIIGLVLLGCFAWRAWRPMPNLALLVAVLACIAGLFLLRSPVALMLTVLLACGAIWLIRRSNN